MVEVNEALYVNIPRPKELRRDVLLLTIESIRLIKREQYLKVLRKEKIATIKELKGLQAEIKTEINKLQRDFPKIKLPKKKEESNKLTKKIEPKKSKKAVKVKIVKQPAHKEQIMDPLEASLRELQNKLNSI